ncbi:MAG TPA: carbohydrate kinase family protein [Candidatus Peribacteraceae bacterium]|nr:carbohydrate kinase family protein [Candidatus Peribacteraceae bacterium]
MDSPFSPSATSRSSRPRTLSIGGATYDLFVRTDQSVVHEHEGKKMFSLPLGDKIRVNDVISTFGGGASNTSVGLSRLGCTASFCGVVGDDQWGTTLLKHLADERVQTDMATVVENEASSFSLVLSAGNGERVILTHPGTARHLHDVTFDREQAGHFDAVFLNHIHAESCVIEDDLIDTFVQNPSIHLSWNPGGCQIESGLREKNNALLVSHTAVLFLNKEEALAFTGTRTVKEALNILSRAGATIVCITDGPNGSFATDGKTYFHCPAGDCTVVDATGAGDAFGTGVTWAVLTGKDLPTALQAGTINAMSVVSVIGAEEGLLTETQMQLSLKRSNLTVTAEPF